MNRLRQETVSYRQRTNTCVRKLQMKDSGKGSLKRKGYLPFFRFAYVVASLLVIAVAGCATVPLGHDWEQRLRADALVLLGEVHDNAAHHQQRLDVLRRAFAAGWRPAIAMEQFDREQQGDIDRARVTRPRDAQHVIDLAAPSPGAGRWTGRSTGRSWNWLWNTTCH